MNPRTKTLIELAPATIDFKAVVKTADALRRERLFDRASSRFESAASLAPNVEVETALLCRAWECAEWGIGRVTTIEGA